MFINNINESNHHFSEDEASGPVAWSVKKKNRKIDLQMLSYMSNRLILELVCY